MMNFALLSQLALAVYVPTPTPPCTESSPVATPAPPVYAYAPPPVITEVPVAPSSYPGIYQDQVVITATELAITEPSSAPLHSYGYEGVETEIPVAPYYAGGPPPAPIHTTEAPVATPPCTKSLLVPTPTPLPESIPPSYHEIPDYPGSIQTPAPTYPQPVPAPVPGQYAAYSHESLLESPAYHESLSEPVIPYHESNPEPVIESLPEPVFPFTPKHLPEPEYFSPDLPAESPLQTPPCTAELPILQPTPTPTIESLPESTPAGLYGDVVEQGPESSEMPTYSSAQSSGISIVVGLLMALVI
jgi:hypothetical protein